ncbi:MAG: oxidoreductase [Cyanobacteria bacterium P01_F01_bin.150]
MEFRMDDVRSQPDKIAVVTGANTGIGYETAMGLAQTNMKVILACRNLEKADKAKARILDVLPNADLEVMLLDLSQLSSVKTFAEQFRRQYDRLDLLINNAGIMAPPFSQTEDGFERQLAVNHLGHFLLTSLLLDLMPNKPESRVVSLSSNAHRLGQIKFDDLQSTTKYSSMAAYAQSKLACLMFADELQRRLEEKGKRILSVCAHPGGSETELARHFSKTAIFFMRLMLVPLMTHPPKKAALPTLYAALGDDVKGGEYFGPQGFLEMSGKPDRATRSPSAQNREVAQQLWTASEELTGADYFSNPA